MTRRSSSWLVVEALIGGLLAMGALGVLLGASTRAQAEQRDVLRDRAVERVLAANVDALALGAAFETRASVGQTHVEVTRLEPTPPASDGGGRSPCRTHRIRAGDPQKPGQSRVLTVERCGP